MMKSANNSIWMTGASLVGTLVLGGFLLLNLITGAVDVSEVPDDASSLLKLLIDLSNAWPWYAWTAGAVAFFLFYATQTRKVFSSLDALDEVRRDLYQSAEQRLRIDERLGVLENQKNEYLTATREDDLRIREAFYLNQLLRPHVTELLEQTDSKLAQIRGGDAKSVSEVYSEAERGHSNFIEQAVQRIIGPFEWTPYEGGPISGIPTPGWAENYYMNRRRMWQLALEQMEARQMRLLDSKFWLPEEDERRGACEGGPLTAPLPEQA